MASIDEVQALCETIKNEVEAMLANYYQDWTEKWTALNLQKLLEGMMVEQEPDPDDPFPGHIPRIWGANSELTTLLGQILWELREQTDNGRRGP